MIRKLTTVALVTLALLVPAVGHANNRLKTFTAAEVGVNGAALSGGAVTSVINTGEDFIGSSVVFHMDITAGTTTTVTFSCEESPDNTTWTWLPYCTSAATSSCSKQLVQFDVTSITKWSVEVATRTNWLRCTFEDLAAGSGTAVVKASMTSP